MLAVRLVIVNFESGSYLGELLDSVGEAMAFADSIARVKVVVVDNASGDSSFEACQRVAFEVELVRLGDNLGFGAAANRGMREAAEAWLVPMNADMLLPRDFFVTLAQRANELSEAVGIVAPALTNLDGTQQASIGDFPTLLRTLGQVFVDRRRRRHASAKRHRSGPIDWATGACLLVRADAWRRLDGFDPAFFLYYEDVDLCARAAALGIHRRFEADLEVVHRNPLAQRKVDHSLAAVIRYSHLRYFRKHRSPIEFRLLSWITRAWSRIALRDDRELGRIVSSLPARVARDEGSPRPQRSIGAA